ncbi:MAG: PDZ domain-containing protein, partial [Gemmatimonadetes bacterium]|nr:PDZ domain-containing protein [Gemmatimonadota bacterium]NIQ51949.1 PDZ domain-containing protein [Gemmatimonadota bacterium]NIU72052.1 PDZ domain-containing protein [Gammaproteobacteria bacterium]NIX42612.1 PDZ domain-containing protein [Gemmatimonadota bacterium]
SNPAAAVAAPEPPELPEPAPQPRGELPAPVADALVAPRPGVPVGELFPRGWFGFGIQCNCSVSTPSPFEPPVWRFNEPPEIFSVEDGSPADRAGLRRGDELLEIDGVPLTSEEGGRAFGAIEAGETVRFRYRRGSATETVTMTAQRRPDVPEAPEQVEAAEDLMRRLAEVREQQEALTAELRERQERQQQLARQQLRDLIEQLEAQGERQREAQVDIQRLLLETLTRQREAPPLPDDRVRFTGTLGDVEIVVRGSSNVITMIDEDDELIIVTGDARIHLKRVREQ